jgi:hypothetical protein
MEFIIEKAKAKNTESLEGVIFKVWWRATKEDAVRYASKELLSQVITLFRLKRLLKRFSPLGSLMRRKHKSKQS